METEKSIPKEKFLIGCPREIMDFDDIAAATYVRTSLTITHACTVTSYHRPAMGRRRRWWYWATATSLASSMVLLFLTHVAGQNTSLAAGRLMTTDQTLTSPDQTFALGFFDAGANSTTRHRFYLAIWYVNVPPRTVVWIANRNASLTDPAGGAAIAADGNLVVIDGNNSTQIWSSAVDARRSPTTAALDERGNLVLRDGEGRVVWQSFDFPTDTLLPGMNIRWNMTTGEAKGLVSWRSPDDPSPGNDYFGPDPVWPSQFIVATGEARRWRDTWLSNGVFSDMMPVNGARSYALYLTVVTANDGMVLTVSVSGDPSLVWRLHLNASGILKLLTWMPQTGNWNTIWDSANTTCRIYAGCGANGVCNKDKLPECECLTGSKPKVEEEWNSGNWSAGCERTSSAECGEEEGFYRLALMKLPDLAMFLPNLSAQECVHQCLVNCSCRAYSYVNVSFDPLLRCFHWTGELLDLEDNYTFNGQDLYIRLSKRELDQLSSKAKRRNHLALVLATTLCGGVISSCAVVYLLWRRFKRKGMRLSCIDGSSSLVGEDLPYFSFVNLQAATGNFCVGNKLGEGGFGPVYKGNLPSGVEIAVKRLSQCSGQGLEEFKTEVKLIAKLQHRNLVRLLGWCSHKEEKLLIYEFMPNKSLDKILFEPTSQSRLEWGRRFQIVEGIAQGLLYLHKHSRLRIVHRDLKTSNILLDSEMIPKISDFGLARIVGGNQLGAKTNRVVGTYGYMSPEYALHGIFSEKSDVYSFGVILLELVSGKRGTGVYPLEHSENLLGYAWTRWMEDRCLELMDSSISMTEEVAKCIHIALLCVQEVAADRPSMPSVVLMLSSDNPSLPSPKEPAFYMRTNAAPPSHDSSVDNYMNNTSMQAGLLSFTSSTYFNGR